jgi:hypothetical protein
LQENLFGVIHLYYYFAHQVIDTKDPDTFSISSVIIGSIAALASSKEAAEDT